MKKMSRTMITILFVSIFLLVPFAATVFADEVGTIDSYCERVTPEDGYAVIQVEVEGVTDAEGMLYIPAYKDAELESIEEEEGELIDDQAKEKNIGELKFMSYKFDSPSSKVKLKLVYKEEKLYEGKKSKQKGSYPDGIKTITYSFVNTTPIDIHNYSVKVFLPEGVELYNMLSPEENDEFDVSVENGLKAVEVTEKSISAQSENKVSMNIYKQSSITKVVVWVICIALSIFFLYMRRETFVKSQRQTKQLNQ